MKRTNLYIEVSSVSPRKSEKQYGYIIEAESNGHPVTVGDFGKAEGSYHLVTLTALIEALKRYQKPSEIHIYCPNGYVLGQFRNIKTWLKNDFKTVKGKPVKDEESWRKVACLTAQHEVITEAGEHSSYSGWIHAEMVKRKEAEDV